MLGQLRELLATLREGLAEAQTLLSMDALVRAKIVTTFGFRFVGVPDYPTALQVEGEIAVGRADSSTSSSGNSSR